MIPTVSSTLILITDNFNEIFNPSGDRKTKWSPSANKARISDESLDAFIPESVDPDQISTLPVPPFEKVAVDGDLTMFEVNDLAYDLDPGIDPRIDPDIDPFDLPEGKQRNAPKLARARQPPAMEVDVIVKKFLGKKNNWFSETNGSQENGGKPLFTVPIIHRGALFETTLSIDDKGDDNGMVTMLHDNPVPGTDWLPVPRWEVRKRKDGIRLLCLQAPRRELTVAELLKKLKSDERIVEQNKQVTERIEWSRTIKGTLVFRDVEFIDDVVLDGCTFERSIEFRECRFMRSLRLHNATVNGSLILDRSQIEGAQEIEEELVKNSLDLRGLKVERLLSLDRLTVYGQLDGKGVRAANAVYGRGLRVSLRQELDNMNRPALDFSYASIDGPLLLEVHDDPSSLSLDQFRRTIVRGSVSFEGLSAKEVKADGLVVGGNLDCQFTNISDCLWLMTFHRTTINWRTVVYGWLNLNHAHVGVLLINGCYVDRSISMVEMRARSIYARGVRTSQPDGKNGFKYGLYRSLIEGDFQASGAVVNNVIEMEGARVNGELNFITGKCGRLSLTVCPWWEGGNTPRLIPCDAHGLTLRNFTVDKSLICVGLRLGAERSQSASSDGGVLTHDLRIGGSLLFWNPEQSKRLKQRLKDGLHESLLPLYPEKSERLEKRLTEVWDGNSKSINDAIAEIRAELSGSINLEGAHVEGAVNLCRTKVAGSIDLANAHVGGSLVSFHESTDPYPCLDCTEMNARNIQVGDDADLRGLKVRMNGQNTGAVNLEGAHVDGTLYLGRTEIEGTINLINTRVGDSLMAFDKDFYQHSLTCTGLNARNMQVGGDVDLRDLRVFKGGLNLNIDGNIELQDVKVAGILSLATPPRTKGAWWNFEPSVLVKDGCIDLAGAHASQIVLSGKSLESKDHGFTLERCKVGQLTIGGFENHGECKFPRKINLTAIEVGDWNVKPNTEAATLLKASDPFDARVYLDLENRLSRQGLPHFSDDIYLAMVGRNKKLEGWFRRLGSFANLVFTRNGTSVFRLACWFIATIIAIAIPLYFPSNVEPVDKTVPQKRLEKQWDGWKAVGLAFSYAVPFRGPQADIGKPRLVGAMCLGPNLKSGETQSNVKSMEGQALRGDGIWVLEFKRIEIPLGLLNNPNERTQLETISNAIDSSEASIPECETKLWGGISPHNYVEFISIGQLLLWLVLAANLPTIMRKRG